MAPVVKVRVTNPMHDSRQSMNDMSSPLQLNTPSQTDDLESDDDGTRSPGSDGRRSPKTPRSKPGSSMLPPRMVQIEQWEIDMNMRYTLGTQEWYLQQRRKDKEASGEIKVEILDYDQELDAMEMSFKKVALETWATLSSGGNLAAGLASALHVNIYLLALGLLLSSPYMGIMTIVRLAVMGTAIQQAYATFFSSYKHFNITNADTLPAAIFVNMLSYAVEMVENANQVKYETELGYQSLVSAADRRADTSAGITGSSGMAADMGTITSAIDANGTIAELDASMTPRLLCVSDGGLLKHASAPEYEEYGCFDQASSTLLVLIMVTTMSVGGLMVLLGTKLNAGPLISFVPVTVQCAFLAGCGGSIFKKGVFFMVDATSLTSSFGAGSAQILVNLAPVIGMSVFILWAEETLHHTKWGRVALPGLLVFLTACFYVLLFFYFSGQAATTEGSYTWSDAMTDAQDPAANGGRSYLPPLSEGRGWLMSPDEVDGSGDYHSMGAVGTLYLPQFTHFRLYHYIIDPVHSAPLDEFTTRSRCEDCSSEGDKYVSGCIWAATGDDEAVPAGTVFGARGWRRDDEGELVEYNKFSDEDNGLCHHRQFKWVVMWGAIFNSKQVVNLVVITIVTLLAILLNSAAIEEETERDVEFDQELKTVGMGNVFSGLAGGFCGFSSVSKTMLCYHLGGRHHSGVFAVAYYGGFWFVFYLFGRFVPLPVLGSFICAIGLELLIEQTWHMRHKVTTEELLEIVFLLFVMIFSFVGGFALGMFMALVAFTAKYTSTPVIKSILNGDEYQGSATRSKETRAFLHRYASEIITLRLQGFIFFFTAEKLRKSVIGVYESLMDDGKHVSTMILDFRMVESVDATAVKKLKKLLRYTDRVGLKICFTNLTEKMREMFAEEGLVELRIEQDDHGHEVKVGLATLKFFKEADTAVEWACDELLRSKHQFNMMLPDPKTGKFTAKIIFRNILTYIKLGFGALVAGEEFDSATFRNFGTSSRWKSGQVIVNQGADADKLVFLTEGSALMMRRMRFDGKDKKLEKKYRGTICCESNFFLRKPMHFSLIAAQDMEVIEFSRAQFLVMEKEAPEIAERIMTHVMEKMGETIKRLTRENHLLLRDNREEVLDETGHILGAEEDDELFGSDGMDARPDDDEPVFFSNQGD